MTVMSVSCHHRWRFLSALATCALFVAGGFAQNAPLSDTATPLGELRSQIPADFFSPAIGTNRTLERLQRDFDIYSWHTFIALNWPANSKGEPSTSKKIGQDGDHPAVWEYWKSTSETFLGDGSKPPPWGERPSHASLLPVSPTTSPQEKSSLLNLDQKLQSFDSDQDITLRVALMQHEVYRVITKLAKGHSWFATEQPFDTGPLIDQNGQYARFEIVMNRPMFEFIVTNQLYHVKGQEDYLQQHKRIVFPIGRFERDSAGNIVTDSNRWPVSVSEHVGSIVVKAAWKPLSAAEIKSGRFHMRRTVVYTPHDDVNGIPKWNLSLQTLGLVGMHIVHKSEDVAQWNWSTFEHVDNCPEYSERRAKVAADGKPKTYNFFNPAQYDPNQPDSAQINRPPSRPWNPLKVEPPDRRAQIVRMIPLTEETRALNRDFQALLRKVNPKSAWQYYMLVSTQWPTRPSGLFLPHDQKDGDVLKLSPADILGAPAPVFLGNTTLESYIQGTVPNTSSSCMDCHANATTKSGPGKRVHFSDFTFVLERAKEQPSTGTSPSQ